MPMRLAAVLLVWSLCADASPTKHKRFILASTTNTSVTLDEVNGKSFHLINNADQDRFEIQEGRTNHQTKLLAVAANSGDTTLRGNLQIGGESPGDRTAAVTSYQGHI